MGRRTDPRLAKTCRADLEAIVPKILRLHPSLRRRCGIATCERLRSRAHETVHVLAVITAKPARRAEILEAFQADVAAGRAEDGCIEYVATVDAEGAGSVQTRFGEDTFRRAPRACPEPRSPTSARSGTWLKIGEPRRAQGPHAPAPHMAAYAAKTKDLIRSRVIHILSPA